MATETIDETIDQKTLSHLVEAGAVHAAHVVGHGNGWTIAAKYGLTERFLSAKRGEVRVFRRLETLVNFLRDIGINQFNVDAAGYDPESVDRTTRPDRSEALKKAHAAAAYDKWFREQVKAGIAEADDPMTPWASHNDVKIDMTRQRAFLKSRLGGDAK